MRFRENPFYLLNATPADSRQRLQQLVEDAQLGRLAADAEAAYTELIKPDRRLAAELRWLPGAEAEMHAAIRNQLAQGKAAALNGQAQPIAHLNALLFSLEVRTDQKPEELAADLQDICRLWGEQDSDELLDIINAQRLAGGWKQIQHEQLRAALKAYLDEIAIWLTGLFQGEGHKGKKLLYAHADALLALVRRYEAGLHDYAHNELIEGLVSRFELETAALASEEKAKILKLTNERHNPPKVNWSALKTDGMNYAIKRWHRITHPVRLLAQARGMRYQDGEGGDAAALGNEVRLFMAVVFNRFRDVTGALSIAYCLQRCFPELDDLQEQLKKDIDLIKSCMRGEQQEQQRTRNPTVTTIKRILMIGLIILAAFLSRCDSEPSSKPLHVPVPPARNVDQLYRHLPKQ